MDINVFGYFNLPFNIPTPFVAPTLLLSFIISSWVAYDKIQDTLTDPEISFACEVAGIFQGNSCRGCADTFDFVVIGGGNAYGLICNNI